MKKIMKKALSLALALVMVLTLAPVTADAADNGTAELATGLYSYDTTVSVAANSACYYEIAMPDAETYEFTVTGATGFEVSTCTEADGVWSITDNTTVSDTNGSIASTIAAASASWEGYAGFVIKNNTGSEQEYAVKILLPEGTSSNPKAVSVNSVGGSVEVTVPANTQYYIGLSLPTAQTEYQIVITGDDGFGLGSNWGMPTMATNGEISMIGAQYWSPYQFSLVNTTENDMVCTITVNNVPVGAESNPDSLVLSENASLTLSGNEYWYTWTATEAGTFTLTMNNDTCANGWTYKLNEPDYTSNHFSTGWGENDKNVCEVVVAQGDVITIGLSIPTGEDPYTYSSGTLYFSTAFAAGVVDDGNNNDDNNNNNNNDDTPTEGEITGGDENYAESTAPIVVGDNALTVSNMYAYTVFTFEPTEIGTYTLTSEDSVMGIVSNNGMWVTVTPSADTVSSHELTWECNDVGQSIMIAVMADTNVANVKVSKEELVVKEIPQTVYPASADAYVFTGDASAIEYVDVQGTTTDKAVLGDDGFYHLNDKTGPILLVNLDDSVFTFVTNETFGKLPVATYDSNGEVVSTVAYGSYVEACLANASSVKHPVYDDVLLYPLTEGLMEVYKTYGAQQGWYNTSMGGYVIGQFNNKYNAEDIWMFACMYVPNAEDGSIEVPPVAIKPDAIVDEKGNVTGYEPIKEEVVKAKIEEAVAENRDLVVETTADGVIMTFAPADLKDAKAVELNIEVALKNDVKDETVAKNEDITDKNFVLKIEFAHTGDLPATATITIPVPADLVKDLEKLFYYEIKADGTLEFVCEAPVKDGVATVKQAHCSDYVLLTERVDVEEEKPADPPSDSTQDNTTQDNTTPEATPEASTTPNEAPTTTSPKTGDDTNIALWVAVLGLGVVAIAGSVVMRKREF